MRISRNIGEKKKGRLVAMELHSLLRNERYAILKFWLHGVRICGATANRCGNTLWQMYTPTKSRINAEERAIGGCA